MSLETFTTNKKTDWEDWNGGILQMSAMGTSFGAGTLTLQLTYDNVSGQTDPTTKIDVDTLTENGYTEGVALIGGGKYRMVLTGATGPTFKAAVGAAQNSFYEKSVRKSYANQPSVYIGTNTKGVTTGPRG